MIASEKGWKLNSKIPKEVNVTIKIEITSKGRFAASKRGKRQWDRDGNIYANLSQTKFMWQNK
jgi:hypothetical protein